MKVRSHTATVVLALAGYTTAAAAIDINLNFDSLPSTQGWTYFDAGVAAEEDVFSILNSNTLSQNTFGIGSGSAGYALWGRLDPNLPFSFSFTARFIAEEQSLNDFGAFAVAAYLPSEAFGIGIGPSRIKDINQNTISTSIDTSTFHDYRVDVNPGVGYQISIDGNFLGTGFPRPYASPNYFLIGDFTGGANAQGEFTALRILQAVPEPKAGFLLAADLCLLFVAMKRRQTA